MRTTSLVVLAILLGASSALSQQAGIMACGLRKSDCRDLIGKRLWVRVPDSNPNSVEFSEKPNDWKQTLKMKAGSFLVTDVIRNSTYGYDFFVELPDGKRGYVG